MPVEERYRALFERSGLAVFVLDLQGRFLDANDAALELFGYSRGELAASSFLDLLDDEQRQSSTAKLERLRSGSRCEVAQRQLRRKDGSAIWIETVTTALHEDGRPAAVHGVAWDISARLSSEAALRDAEERLARSQKLEAMGRLAGGVAHDFNNILSSIGGFTELIRREAAVSSAVLDYLDEIKGSVESASGLTNQLLAFARRRPVQPEPVDLCAMLTGMQDMLGRLLGEDVQIVSKFSEGPSEVFMDRSQLEQIVLNLAVNAREAMPDGGTLAFATSQVRIDATRSRTSWEVEPGDYIELAISDTGHGMEASILSRIYEPFFTTKQNGSGLGLATVYGIVKQARGDIQVTSEPGAGTTISICLPRSAEQESQAPRGAVKSRVPAAGTTILVAEDDARVRNVTCRLLRLEGFKVLEADDGQKALDQCRRYPGAIDLLLTDVVMPGLGGVKLAAQVEALRPEMRILFMSGYIAGETGPICPETLRAPLLMKPFTPDELLAQVAKSLVGPPGLQS